MKSFMLSLAVMSLMLGSAVAQPKREKPNYKVMQRAISDSSSHLYYPKLMARYQSGDSTLNLEERRHLYYGYQFQPTYNPYGQSSHIDQLSALLSKENHTLEDLNEMDAVTDLMLEENPLDMNAMSYKLYVNDKLGKQAEFKRYLTRGRIILDAIKSTGDGKTEKTAFYVIDTSDEYTLVNVLGYRFGGQQSLTKNMCDLLSLVPNEEKITGLYFDVNACFDFMKNRINDK